MVNGVPGRIANNLATIAATALTAASSFIKTSVKVLSNAGREATDVIRTATEQLDRITEKLHLPDDHKGILGRKVDKAYTDIKGGEFVQTIARNVDQHAGGIVGAAMFVGGGLDLLTPHRVVDENGVEHTARKGPGRAAADALIMALGAAMAVKDLSDTYALSRRP